MSISEEKSLYEFLTIFAKLNGIETMRKGNLKITLFTDHHCQERKVGHRLCDFLPPYFKTFSRRKWKNDSGVKEHPLATIFTMFYDFLLLMHLHKP